MHWRVGLVVVLVLGACAPSSDTRPPSTVAGQSAPQSMEPRRAVPGARRDRDGAPQPVNAGPPPAYQSPGGLVWAFIVGAPGAMAWSGDGEVLASLQSRASGCIATATSEPNRCWHGTPLGAAQFDSVAISPDGSCVALPTRAGSRRPV